jgi:hypothetical protein
MTAKLDLDIITSKGLLNSRILVEDKIQALPSRESGIHAMVGRNVI